MKQTIQRLFSKFNLLQLTTLICTTLVSTLSFGQAGNAPMQTLPSFPGFFAIDGYLQRQNTNGDWLAAAGGSANNFVMNNAGTPVVPLGYHLLDLYNDQDADDIFDGGNKLFQNPNDWGWRSQKPPAKDDINNATAFIALNPANSHIWCAISGDRMSTNGTSYLDFEFYQNTITKIGGPTTGGFNSTGPHNGRTIGDLSLTLEFTNGGSFAQIFYLQWQPGSEAGEYVYGPLTPPPGSAFAAANGGTVNVPYGAFGNTTYAELQFAEGAVDMTALIGGTGPFGECASLPFKSLFVKTKSSAETTADLKDFIAPLQFNACFDRTAPVINCPNTLNLGCNATVPGPSGATASDNCDGSITPVAADGPVQSNGCNRSMNRTWTAIDDCGNMATCVQQINWKVDVTPPVISGNFGDVDLGCNPGNPSGSLGSASASDACGAVTISQSDGSVSSNGCARAQTRTFVARDECGNTSSASRTVRWTSDVTGPTITCPGNVSLGCNATVPAANPASVTATDACGPTTVTHAGDATNLVGCTETTTRKYRAIDGCGNTSTCAQTITRTVDNTAPVFTGSYDAVNLGCNPADPAGSLGTDTATDAFGSVPITHSDGSIQTSSCGNSQTRRFTARDACGNTSTASRTVNWGADATPPVFTGSYSDVDLGCNPGNPDGSLGSASATDGCGPVTITQSDGSVQSNGCARSRTRTFVAKDACNNTSSVSRTVRWISDPNPPVFTGSYGDVDLGCNPGNPDGSLGSASATDACGGVTITQQDGSVQSNGCARSRTRTFTAKDGCNNTSTTSRTVRWISDPNPPVFTGSYGDVDLGCNPGDPAGSLGSASATDACGSVTITQQDGSVQSNGCARSQTRTFTARDGCNNTSTTSRTVRWIFDNTPPAFTGGNYGDVNLGCNPGNPDGSLGSATATDACGAVTITQQDGSVQSSGCNLSKASTFTARDCCGNTSTISLPVRWNVDVTPPVFTTTPASVDIECNAPIPTSATPTASDACGTPTVSSTGSTDNPADCSTGFSRVITRSWKAVDGCGNSATYTQTIRVACCPSAFCTYTMGAYGTEGGSMCDGENGDWTTLQFINNILANYGGSFTVGKPGRSVLVNSAQTVIDRLPGTGTATELAPGDINLSAYTPLNPQGGVRNVLLGQTITLKLNLGITNSQLSGFVLQAGELATQDPVGGCGGDVPEERICHYNTLSPYNLISVENEYTYRTFTQAMIDAIPGAKTVGNLLELANRALANVDGVVGYENGLSLSDINKAVSYVNEVFDECKLTVGWDVARCPAIDPTPGDGRVALSSTPTLTVSAYPNPYQDNFSLTINSPVTGQAQIGFYTIDGVKVGELKRDVVANRSVSVPFNVPATYKTRIVYAVSVGGYNAKGIVLSPNEPKPLPKP